MTATGHVSGVAVAPSGRTTTVASGKLPWFKDLRRHWPLYLMALPAILSAVIFGYGPLFGLAIAFLDYSPVRGILHSPWVGLANFRQAFHNPFFLPALRNSIIISVLKLAVGFPSAITLALLLNEVRARFFKSAVQTATMLPYFISWVVAASMWRAMLGSNGVVNEIIEHVFHGQAVNFLSDPAKFRWIIVFQDTWKFCGYFAVLYLAAIAAIDPTLYEAALVDGANRWQQMRHITIPGISTTMVTLFVLLTGWLIRAGFEQVYVMYNVSVYSTGDILETLTLRLGLNQTLYGLATAIGLFQSVVSLLLVMSTNLLVKRFDQEGLF
ncbi:MAG: ABC transporter permease subunit [Anaerolineae bacterium]|nr:ABC transporter permease subunit [Anaerolineae bacterium]